MPGGSWRRVMYIEGVKGGSQAQQVDQCEPRGGAEAGTGSLWEARYSHHDAHVDLFESRAKR